MAKPEDGFSRDEAHFMVLSSIVLFLFGFLRRSNSISVMS